MHSYWTTKLRTTNSEYWKSQPAIKVHGKYDSRLHRKPTNSLLSRGFLPFLNQIWSCLQKTMGPKNLVNYKRSSNLLGPLSYFLIYLCILMIQRYNSTSNNRYSSTPSTQTKQRASRTFQITPTETEKMALSPRNSRKQHDTARNNAKF